jgi:hypothetical protein
VAPDRFWGHRRLPPPFVIARTVDGNIIAMDEPKPRFTVAWINVACAVFSSIGAFIFSFDSGTSTIIPFQDDFCCSFRCLK